MKVVDTITADTGIVWTVDSADPTANQMANGGLTWNDVGPLNPGQSKDLTINMKVGPASGGGQVPRRGRGHRRVRPGGGDGGSRRRRSACRSRPGSA